MQLYNKFSTYCVQPDQKLQKQTQTEKHPSSRLVLLDVPPHTANLNGFSNSSYIQQLSPAQTAENLNPSQLPAHIETVQD